MKRNHDEPDEVERKTISRYSSNNTKTGKNKKSDDKVPWSNLKRKHVETNVEEIPNRKTNIRPNTDTGKFSLKRSHGEINDDGRKDISRKISKITGISEQFRRQLFCIVTIFGCFRSKFNNLVCKGEESFSRYKLDEFCNV